MPPIPGLDGFEGPTFHTARWHHDIELAGKRVAVVGTGCSAIQVVPAIQPQVAHVDVYQRSPGWTIPKLDFAYRERTKRLFARYPRLQRLDRQANFAFHEYGALGLTRHPWLMKPVKAVVAHADQARDQRSGATAQGHADRRDRLQADHAHRRLVSDAHQAERRPRHRPRRGRDRRGPLAGGHERPADVLIFATGFHSHGFTAPMEVAGEDGRTLERRGRACRAPTWG